VLITLLLAAFGYELRWRGSEPMLILVFGAILKRLFLDRDRLPAAQNYTPRPPRGSASSHGGGRSIRRTPSRTS